MSECKSSTFVWKVARLRLILPLFRLPPALNETRWSAKPGTTVALETAYRVSGLNSITGRGGLKHDQNIMSHTKIPEAVTSGSMREPAPQENQSSGDLLQPNVVRSQDFSGLLLEERIYTSTISNTPHTHSQSIFCSLFEGRCTEQWQGKIREYRPFDSEFLLQDELHSLTFHEPTTRCLSLKISKPLMEQAKASGLSFAASIQFRGGAVAEIFSKLDRELRINDGASNLAVQGLTAELLAHASRDFVFSSETRIPEWLKEAKQLLQANFTEQLRLHSVSAELRVHPAHLAREFRRHFGRTMGQYVRELRIERSMLELARAGASLADIGAAVGFADQSHFSRIFKAHTGMTPKEYRNLLSENGRPQALTNFDSGK